MSTEFAIVIAVIGLIATILSIVLAVVTLSRNKRQDDTDVKSRLTRIETDIIYIRENLDKRGQWEASIEERVRALERSSVKTT